MQDISYMKCFKCGTEIEPDDNRYRVYVRIESDFDGFASEDGENAIIDECMTQFESAKQQELEDGVYEEMDFILCVGCREMFSGELTGMYAGYAEKTGRMKWQ